MAFGSPDSVRMGGRVVDYAGLFIIEYSAPDPADLHISDCRYCFRLGHSTGTPAWIAQGHRIETTGSVHFSDEAKLAIRQLLSHRQTRVSDLFLAFTGQRFSEHPVDCVQDGTLPGELVLRPLALGNVGGDANATADSAVGLQNRRVTRLEDQ